MPRTRFHGIALLLFPLLAGSMGRGADGVEFFEQRIRPVLVEQCHVCHSASAEKLKGGLLLDSREGLLRGGESGPALVVGDPEASPVIRAMTYTDPDLQMPPKTRLPASVVEDFRRWVKEGAVWPSDGAASAGPAKGFDLAKRREEHWAWQPVRPPEVPRVRDEAWVAGDLDRFVLARLEGAGLRPAPGAGKRVLIRRASFVLTGLPPEPGEVAAFLEDESPDAFEHVVDRLLASPHYGERWARHWLDKVRYAETMGHEFDYPIVGAWRYRDYVIRAFNGDVPYDRFVREQIAGDAMPDPRRNPDDGLNESLVGTMQYWLVQQVHSPVDVRAQQAETTDNQIDVVGKAFLGLTVACARCHDHKFDALSAKDYYAMYGLLSSSRFALRAIDDPAPRRRQAESLRRERDSLRIALADGLLVLGSGMTNGLPVGPLAGGVRLRSGDVRMTTGEEWFPDGEAFTLEERADGQPVWIGGTNVPVVRMVPPGWRHSAALGRRMQGALRSPTFILEQDFLHLRLAGRGARFSLAVEGFTLIQAPIYGALRQAVRNEEPHWVTLDVSMWRGRRAWLEFADLGAPDPASPLPPETRSADGWIAVGDIVASPMRAAPGWEEVPAPAGPEALAALVTRWRGSPGTLTPGEVSWLGALLAANRPGAAVGRAWETLEAGIPAPVLVAAMAEGTGVDEPVFIRGNHRKTGEVVGRRFLEALPVGPGVEAYREASGRLALAEAVTHPDNPYFSRVMVNWVWAHLFGRGLVTSVDNFGVLGEPPTHPELLDGLADRFRAGGWSVKRLVREMVLSRTWQMQSRAGDAAAELRDPDNRLWHRANLRRLEGEAIRDAMLSMSGRLDPRVGGPSVPMHLTPFLEGRGRPDRSGPADGDGRRSIYLEVRRNFLSPFLLAFDTPVPATTVGRRSVSNVPAQALAMMNDPFVREQAQRWGRRVRESDAAGDRERVVGMYERALARVPSEDEATAAMVFVRDRVGAGADAAGAWGDLGHVLFNAKEFTFVE